MLTSPHPFRTSGELTNTTCSRFAFLFKEGQRSVKHTRDRKSFSFACHAANLLYCSITPSTGPVFTKHILFFKLVVNGGRVGFLFKKKKKKNGQFFFSPTDCRVAKFVCAVNFKTKLLLICRIIRMQYSLWMEKSGVCSTICDFSDLNSF